MSRCFPYPPPGCSRNGATYEALIESIKLKKETDKAKAERKKEKRAKKEQKKNEKRKAEEKAKIPKKPTECQQDSHNKKTETKTEVLERSDLTEEHGQPITSQNPSYSSDSTQNSNKRKRDDVCLPDGFTGHVKSIKIRLPKKHQGPDSSKETLCSNSGRTDPQSLSGADARLNTWKPSNSGITKPSVPSAINSVNGRYMENRTLVSNNRKTGVFATSGGENIAAKEILSSQTKSNPCTERLGTKTNYLQGRKQSAPSSARPIPPASRLKHELSVPSSSRQPPIPANGKPVLPQSHLEQVTPRPSSVGPTAPSVSRKIDVQGVRAAAGKDQLTSSSGTPVLPPNHLTKSTTTKKRSISEITLPGNMGPTSSEKKQEDSKIPVPCSSNNQNVGPTRFEKKLLKRHSKYEKLVGSWVPPVLQAQLPDDEDWLSKRANKTARSSTSTSSREEDVETCRESSLWQPCTRLLVEVDLHALPYTVPF